MDAEIATVKYPRWILQLTPELHREEKLKFLLRLAAVHATPEGTLGALAGLLGKNKYAFQPQFRSINTRPLDIKVAIEIEKIVGTDVVSRQALCPHIFE